METQRPCKDACDQPRCVNPLLIRPDSGDNGENDVLTDNQQAITKENVYQILYLHEEGKEGDFISSTLKIEPWIVNWILSCPLWARLQFSANERLAALTELDEIMTIDIDDPSNEQRNT